jgi:hypothetical protein
MIERKLGFSNRKMWQHCELLQSIVEQKVMTKVGRGKNAVNVEVYKYKNNDDVIKNISESIDYYRIETMREQKLTFRDYQKEIILKGTEMLLENKFLYLAMEVRTGKTLTSLAIAEKVNILKNRKKEFNYLINEVKMDRDSAWREATGIVVHGDLLAEKNRIRGTVGNIAELGPAP